MATTVLEALENAQINFETAGRLTGAASTPIFQMAMEQLKNGIAALDNDMGPHDEIQEHIGAPVKRSHSA